MEQNVTGSDRGPQGGDYEYDEAHDALEGPQGRNPAARRVSPPPRVDLDQGGDYGYDESHDFGAP